MISIHLKRQQDSIHKFQSKNEDKTEKMSSKIYYMQTKMKEMDKEFKKLAKAMETVKPIHSK